MMSGEPVPQDTKESIIMQTAGKALRLALAVGSLSIFAAGCTSAQKSDADHPADEHPNAEHPQGEHPESEHPQGEHPKGEHPDRQQPTG